MSLTSDSLPQRVRPVGGRPIRSVTGTAFVVAEFRAEENYAAHPLYRDPIVHLFLDEASRQAAARGAPRLPPPHGVGKSRDKKFDHMLGGQMLCGCSGGGGGG